MAYTPEKFAAVKTEAGQQMALVLWATQNRPTWPCLDMLFAVPNGGQRDIREAARLKQQGVRAGVPDMCLPVARGGFLSLWLELKRPASTTGKGVKRRIGKTSEDQDSFIAKLRAQGHAVVTAYSYDDARTAIVDYLALGETYTTPSLLYDRESFLKKHCDDA